MAALRVLSLAIMLIASALATRMGEDSNDELLAYKKGLDTGQKLCNCYQMLVDEDEHIVCAVDFDPNAGSDSLQQNGLAVESGRDGLLIPLFHEVESLVIDGTTTTTTQRVASSKGQCEQQCTDIWAASYHMPSKSIGYKLDDEECAWHLPDEWKGRPFFKFRRRQMEVLGKDAEEEDIDPEYKEATKSIPCAYFKKDAGELSKYDLGKACAPAR